MLEKLFSYPTVQNLHRIIKKHERFIPAGALLFGFIWDSLTLGRPDQLFENVVILGYLFLSAFMIILLSFGEKKGIPSRLVLLTILQFSFGNLAGGLAVLYGKSGTFEGSFLFFLLIGAFVVGNEFFKNKYARLHFQITAWYFLTLSYLTLIVPVLLKSVSTFVFLISGALSLGAVFLLLLILYPISLKRGQERIKKTLTSVAGVFIVFNGFYFLNILPPVPLSLKDIGIYHTVSRTGIGQYYVSFEEPRWYEFYRDTNVVFHRAPGERAYCFSSVFAPTDLSAPIFHRWEYYNSDIEKWETRSRISFNIVGGRETGYRGYSAKFALTPGKWRCNVETERGALIGRTTFWVDDVTKKPPLSERTL